MVLEIAPLFDLLCKLQNLIPMLCCLIHHIFVGLTKLCMMKIELTHFNKGKELA